MWLWFPLPKFPWIPSVTLHTQVQVFCPCLSFSKNENQSEQQQKETKDDKTEQTEIKWPSKRCELLFALAN